MPDPSPIPLPAAEELQESRKICEAATEGPWVNHDPAYEDCRTIRAPNHNGITVACMTCGKPKEDGDFVEHARSALPLRNAQCARLLAENKQLLFAIAEAGFGLLKTSGNWSIHDVSELGKAEQQKTLETINENVQLAVENQRLKEMLKGSYHQQDHWTGGREAWTEAEIEEQMKGEGG